MNKPLAVICAGIAGAGLLVLAFSTWLTVVYGHGDPGAGNFNRCEYVSTQDPQTGKVLREWAEIGESTESSLIERLDMWFVGLTLVAVGAGIHVAERSSRGRAPYF